MQHVSFLWFFILILHLPPRIAISGDGIFFPPWQMGGLAPIGGRQKRLHKLDSNSCSLTCPFTLLSQKQRRQVKSQKRLHNAHCTNLTKTYNIALMLPLCNSSSKWNLMQHYMKETWSILAAIILVTINIAFCEKKVLVAGVLPYYQPMHYYYILNKNDCFGSSCLHEIWWQSSGGWWS